MKTTLRWLPLTCLVLMTGCGLEGPVPSAPKSDTAANNTPAPNAVAAHPGGEKKSAETQQGMAREKLEIGSGEKGRGYGEGFIAMPLKALWSVKSKLAADQVHHALELYKASQGHPPKTHQEFMDRIINENHIQLEALPAGSSYLYDPSQGEIGELMITRPKEP